MSCGKFRLNIFHSQKVVAVTVHNKIKIKKQKSDSTVFLIKIYMSTIFYPITQETVEVCPTVKSY